MRLRADESAASPLMVIATFVLVASGATALLFFAFVDTSPPSVALQQVSPAGIPAFEVVAEHGGLHWDALNVTFTDAAGADHAVLYLQLPSGPVQPGDRIDLRSGLPAGSYLLRVFDGGRELARLALRV